MKFFSPSKSHHQERRDDEESRAWLNKVLDAKNELGNFVTMRRRGGRAIQYVGFWNGSFNVSLRYKFSDGGPDALIRIPKPGPIFAAVRDEKLSNEVQVMEFLRQKTTIPLPRIHSWGLTSECPRQLGPFIIMDYALGTPLSTVLKQPTKSKGDDVILDADIQDSVLDKIYDQIADYHLQLSQLTFPRIGAISKDNGVWSVNDRPLTYNMNELATIAGYPVDTLPDSAFNSASEYFKAAAQQHLTHLWTQRNVGDDEDISRARLIARHQFAQLIPKYCAEDSGPFIPFCDNLRPSKMLVDPKTHQITAVLDFGFTNAMPAQFTYDPPSWLLLSGPEVWLNRGSLEDFRTIYEPRMEQYLRALESVEDESVSEDQDDSEPLLSARMRDSWTSGRFWFNYAARKSFDVDAVYWAALYDGSTSVESLDAQARATLEPFREQNLDQLKAHKGDFSVRVLEVSS